MFGRRKRDKSKSSTGSAASVASGGENAGQGTSPSAEGGTKAGGDPEKSDASHEDAEAARARDAAAGIDCLLNDDVPGAERIFEAHGDASPAHAFGLALCASVRAIMSFEEKDVDRATALLSTAEGLATSRAKSEKERVNSLSKSSAGWFKGWRSARPSNPVTGDADGGSNKSVEERREAGHLAGLRFDIVAADCNLLAAAIGMLTKEAVSEYVRAALKLRRSLATFNKTFKLLFPDGQEAGGSSSSLSVVAQSSSSSLPAQSELDRTLYAGVHFGIGLWSLVLSHMPPQARALLSLIGLSNVNAAPEADLEVEEAAEALPGSFEDGSLSPSSVYREEAAIETEEDDHPATPASDSSSSSRDHRFGIRQLRKCLALSDPFHSPLAALALCAYHTSVSGFASGRGTYGPEASLREARLILQRMRTTYPQGGIWRILEGKLFRLEGHAAKSVEILANETKAYDEKKGTGAVHLRLFAGYELAWSYLVAGQAEKAATLFDELLANGSFSRAFYAFAAGVSHFEAAEDLNMDKDRRAKHVADGVARFEQVPSLTRKRFRGKVMPLEQYATESSKRYLEGMGRSTPLSPYHEFLYFWNGFRQFSPAQLDATTSRLRDGISGGKATPGERVALLLLLGCALREKGEVAEARETLEAATTLAADLRKVGSSDPLAKFAGPYSLYERAVAKLEELGGERDARQIAEADELLKRIGEASGFWFEMRLHMRVHYIFLHAGK